MEANNGSAPRLNHHALEALLQLDSALHDCKMFYHVAQAAAYTTKEPKKVPEGWLMEEVREFLRAEGDARFDELIDVCYTAWLVSVHRGPSNHAALNDRQAIHDLRMAAQRVLTLDMSDAQALCALDRWFEKNRRRGVVY